MSEWTRYFSRKGEERVLERWDSMLGPVGTSVFAPCLILPWLCRVQFFSSSAPCLWSVWVPACTWERESMCVRVRVHVGVHTSPRLHVISLFLRDTHIYLYTRGWWKVWFSRCQKQSCFWHGIMNGNVSSWWNLCPGHPESSFRQSLWLCVTQHSHGVTLTQTGKPWSNPSSVMTLLPSWRVLCTQQTRRLRNCC